MKHDFSYVLCVSYHILKKMVDIYSPKFNMSPLQNDGWIGKVNFQGAILNFRSVGCGCSHVKWYTT